MRRSSRVARDARKDWYVARRDTHLTTGEWPWQLKSAVADITEAMWAAERVLSQWAERWREVLAAREAMLVAERWNLAELEKWAQAQPC